MSTPENRGVVALAAWMERTGTGVRALARAVRRSHVAVSKWKRGDSRPSDAERQKLDRLSNGEVGAHLWLSDAERAEIDGTEPLAPPVAA